jgi:hypothetical protein
MGCMALLPQACKITLFSNSQHVETLHATSLHVVPNWKPKQKHNLRILLFFLCVLERGAVR